MWDYLVDTFETDDLQGWLQHAGALGWELVHYHRYPDMRAVGGGPLTHAVIMKKPKAD